MPTLDSTALMEIVIALVFIDVLLAGVAFRGWRRRFAGQPQVLASALGGVTTPAQPAPGSPFSGRPSDGTASVDGGSAAREAANAPMRGESQGEPTGDDQTDVPDAGTVDEPAAATAGRLVDPETGLETALAWDEALRHEAARAARYGHAATVIVIELEGLDRLANQLGKAVADKLIVPVAETLHRHSRAADCVARVGHARFHVLMPETDEISAINYVDRIRESVDMWLEAGAVSVRVAVGWASPPAHGSLADALRLADERMQADRRTRIRPRPVHTVPARSERVGD
ncbi:MAG TPA: diguanylate cyclase [Candidatus Limnocylindrales bacterium]|nr:diguanylate cyclase [Candidatus Limnocylindrales bacterium]